jgi:hypothetical protein
MCTRVAASISFPSFQQNESPNPDLNQNCGFARDITHLIHSSLISLRDTFSDSILTVYAILKKWLEEISVLPRAIAAVVGEIVGGTSIQIKELATETEFQTYRDRVAELEAKAEYPLGPHEKFKINHGADYFAFFKRLGELHYFVASDGDKVVGVGAGVLRTVEGKQVWYLCDLKVVPEYRGRYIPMHMFKKAAWLAYKSTIGYAISMNPAEGENRIVKMFRNHSWIPVSPVQQLALFSLDRSEMQAYRQQIEEARGPLHFLSMKGKKDLILQSNKQAMPLLHVQFGAKPSDEQTVDSPQDGFTHMFCMPEQDPLYNKLVEKGLKPSATASIVSRGMEGIDFNFIQTSEI